MFSILDILGTVAFAVSGTLAAIQKRLDLFGILTISFVTAIGGGTLRDVMIGNTPVLWMQDLSYFYIVLVSTVLAIIFRKRLSILRTSIFLFDTIGLGLFTLVGLEKGVAADLDPLICISLGTISACFGGVLRDILCNEIPVIFQKEIYATACIFGGFIFFLLKYLNLNDDLIFLSTAGSIITIRLLAVIKKWSLPTITL
ncbi:trimeric intracellular cation channel family protein [Myroides ceti]|uniref:Trimeric intracellular cation channel family protein n=1 Tax=Paenimyroides ceti TaxID=395087 RepID=A0ABT8CU07_9FLAO|nr:trimeric intracellular cation channel family protein [Paenimyroides ceti]MDN3707037.1 trimeric intracellular cation channel family protein [Paenimyroides ceti]